jgi:hypothetical protein
MTRSDPRYDRPAMAPLALGVSIRWAHAGPADFTPLLAMIAAILVARFVVGVRLGAVSTLMAAGAGAAWAAAIPRWGVTVPTLLALAVVAAAGAWAGRSRFA